MYMEVGRPGSAAHLSQSDNQLYIELLGAFRMDAAVHLAEHRHVLGAVTFSQQNHAPGFCGADLLRQKTGHTAGDKDIFGVF